MRQNESLHVAIGVNVNVLSDGKSLHTQSRSRVEHATQGADYTSPLIAFVIRIRIFHIRITHKWNVSFKAIEGDGNINISKPKQLSRFNFTYLT